jgi:hypothetical protein
MRQIGEMEQAYGCHLGRSCRFRRESVDVRLVTMGIRGQSRPWLSL